MDASRTLVLTVIHPAIGPEHLRRLQYIDECDFKRYFAKAVELGQVSPEADRQAMIYGLKQYYAIAMLDPANGHAISDVLDPLWHAHMLFSEEYAAFCEAVVGQYMHHKPLLKDDVSARWQVRKLYDNTRVRLMECFSHVDERVWPALSEERLICMHKGNQGIYTALQQHRLYPPEPALAT